NPAAVSAIAACAPQLAEPSIPTVSTPCSPSRSIASAYPVADVGSVVWVSSTPLVSTMPTVKVSWCGSTPATGDVIMDGSCWLPDLFPVGPGTAGALRQIRVG